MAEFFPPVIFEIKAKATEAIASFQQVNGELGKMEKNAIKAGGSISVLEKSSKYAGAAIVGLAGAFSVMAVASVKQLMSVQEAQTKLEVAITNTGVSFKAALPAVQNQAESMAKLGFTTQQTYEALANMTAASGSPRLALNSLGVAADLARAKHMSLADAGTLLARASVGQAKGLGDLGIAIGKTIPKGASFAQVLKAVEDRYGGLAEKSKNDLAVQLQVLQAQFQQLELKLGKALLPTLEKVSNWFIKTGLPALKNFGKWISDNRGLVEALIGSLALIWAAPKIAGLLNALNAIKLGFAAVTTEATAAAGAEKAAFSGSSVLLTMLPALMLLLGFLSAAKSPDQSGSTATAKASPKLYPGQKVAGTGFTNVLNPDGSLNTVLLNPSSGGVIPKSTSKASQKLGADPLAGKGVTHIAASPKKTSASTIVNMTVYGYDAGSIAAKIANQAKVGTPLKGKP